jgi:hypothetical protein
MFSNRLPERKSPLTIPDSAGRALSPAQQLFNKLSGEIDALSAVLEQEPVRMQQLYALFLTHVKPVFAETGALWLQMAEAVQQKTEALKTSRSQKGEAEALIRKMLEEAEDYGADVEHHALRILYPLSDAGFGISEGGFRSAEPSVSAGEIGDSKRMVIEKSEIGYVATGSNAKRNPRSSFADSSHWFKPPKRRLSKAEKARKAFEQSKQKQLKSIYITLAKLLHPDTEPDPVLALEKQEYMKLVTQAYQAKDFTGLLRLELEFVHKEAAHLEQLAENRLAMYNEVLQEQLKHLRLRLDEMRSNPAYYEIGAVLFLPSDTAEKRIRQAGRVAKEWLSHLRLCYREIGQPGNMKEILLQLSDILGES